MSGIKQQWAESGEIKELMAKEAQNLDSKAK
jgi:hypothetical protein